MNQPRQRRLLQLHGDESYWGEQAKTLILVANTTDVCGIQVGVHDSQKSATKVGEETVKCLKEDGEKLEEVSNTRE